MPTDKEKKPTDKKRKKTGGRQKGTPNKTTKVTRETISDILEGMLPQVTKDIAELDPAERVKVFIKLSEFNIPKLQSVQIDMEVGAKKTIEDKLIELSSKNSDKDK